ncbi:MAG: peroxiredoxin [Thiobacillaceae bacterium]
MKWLVAILVLITLGLMAWHLSRPAITLNVGDPATEFQLSDQNGVIKRLSDFRGHWLVLYFYPKNDTPGCTAEACHFRDDILTIRNLDAEVVGISVDQADSYARFAAKYHLPFPLLADTDGHTAAAYGALFKLGPLRFAQRATFIVAPDGRLAQIFRQVDPAQHAAEVTQSLKALQTKNAAKNPAPVR